MITIQFIYNRQDSKRPIHLIKVFTCIAHRIKNPLRRTSEHILFFTFYTINTDIDRCRYTEITDSFKYTSCSIHAFIFFFKGLEAKRSVHSRTHICAFKNLLIRNPGYNMIRTRIVFVSYTSGYTIFFVKIFHAIHQRTSKNNWSNNRST